MNLFEVYKWISYLIYRCTFGPGLMGGHEARKKKPGPSTTRHEIISVRALAAGRGWADAEAHGRARARPV
jgi:hypothetical protein